MNVKLSSYTNIGSNTNIIFFFDKKHHTD